MAALLRKDANVVADIVVSAMEAGHEPGVAISLTGPKGDYAQAFGVAKDGWFTDKPLTLDHRMRIGSITKSFTATALLQQIDKGKLLLSDTLDKFIPGVPNGNTITVEHLMTMRSGVYDYATHPLIQAMVVAYPSFPFLHTSTLVNLIKSHPSSFAPGTQYAYTNSNYILLGEILRKVTGRDPQTVITSDVIAPLGLSNTTWPSSAKPADPYAHGYSDRMFIGKGHLKDQTKVNPELFGTAGLLTSTVGDLQKWAEYLKTEALLFAPTHQLRTTSWYTPQPYPGEGPDHYEYGLGLVKFGSWIGHDGSVPGYSAVAFYDTESGATFAGMENLQTSGLAVFSRIFERIAEYLYPGSMA